MWHTKILKNKAKVKSLANWIEDGSIISKRTKVRSLYKLVHLSKKLALLETKPIPDTYTYSRDRTILKCQAKILNLVLHRLNTEINAVVFLANDMGRSVRLYGPGRDYWFYLGYKED